MTAIQPAATTPCSACPWRKSNHGKRNAGGWYTKANLRRLWAGLRRGERMSCHPTDQRMNDDPGQTVEVPDHVQPRECAGALLMVQRELNLLEALDKTEPEPVRAYLSQRPRGLTRRGLGANIQRAMLPWPGEVPFVAVQDTPDVGLPWIEEAACSTE